MSKRSVRGSGSKGVMVPGLILIAVGVWFLLRALGFPMPRMAEMWPVFPVIVGLSMFVGWLVSPNKRGKHGMMIPATINTLIGVFFFGFTFRLLDGFTRPVFAWSDMAFLWPVFPLIVGVAFFVAWIFSLFRDWGLLIPAGITAGVGIVGLAFTLTGQYEALAYVRDYWPVLLIVLGVVVLIGGLLNRGREASPETEAPQEFKSQDDAQV